jgi:hypothetical protein
LIRALTDFWRCDRLVLNNGEMVIRKGKLKKLGGEKTCSNATSFIIMSQEVSHLGLNTGLQGQKPVSGRLSYVTDVTNPIRSVNF